MELSALRALEDELVLAIAEPVRIGRALRREWQEALDGGIRRKQCVNAQLTLEQRARLRTELLREVVATLSGYFSKAWSDERRRCAELYTDLECLVRSIRRSGECKRIDDFERNLSRLLNGVAPDLFVQVCRCLGGLRALKTPTKLRQERSAQIRVFATPRGRRRKNTPE